MTKKSIIFLIVAAFLTFSCSTKRPSGKTEAEVIFKEAQELIEDGRYIMATERLNSIRSQYPYSYYATHAELLQADILYKQESYVESAAAYILFKDFHPRNEKMSYVIFRIAESFYNQRPSTYDRDLSPLYDAIKYYDELLRLYPKTEYAKGAEVKIADCKNLLMKKEQYVADFYFKTESFEAARYRYLDILKNFSHKPLREHSIKRVVESSLMLKQANECKKHYNNFSSEFKSTNKVMTSLLKKCNKL